MNTNYPTQSSAILHSDSLATSAKQQLSSAQRLFFAGVIVLLLIGILVGIHPLSYLRGTVAIITTGYLSLMVFNLLLVTTSAGNHAFVQTSKAAKRLSPNSLPTYTVLVPLYKETQVVEQLIKNLNALDYPTSRLQIILLLEADDLPMIELLSNTSLPQHFKIVEVPVSQPRTKPKALNYGLRHVQSDFCVVYDAEDRPESDQLLKAVAAFKLLPPSVVCLQAMLAFHNTHQNWLTRFFAAEYASWFSLYIPGLARNNLLFLLGGTSNHFRVDALRAVGAWDPYNVTEDADLGIRLVKAGYEVKVLKSYTWEEANARPLSWINQRSRWIKGYMQTYLAHMRNPWQLLKQMGLPRFIAFQFMVGIAPVANMLNPIFWGLTLLYFLTHWAFIEWLFPGPMLYLGMISLLVGNFISIYISLTGAMLQQEYSNVKLMLLTPFYWIMMSVAAWKAFHQLIVNPHYWEKTQHGLAAVPTRPIATPKLAVPKVAPAPAPALWSGVAEAASAALPLWLGVAEAEAPAPALWSGVDESALSQAQPAPLALQSNRPVPANRYYLGIYIAGVRLMSIALGDEPITIGRSQKYSHLIIPDRYLSRKHVTVTPNSPYGVTITDMNTVNGTYLENNRIESGLPTVWQIGQTLRMSIISIRLDCGIQPVPTHEKDSMPSLILMEAQTVSN